MTKHLLATFTFALLLSTGATVPTLAQTATKTKVEGNKVKTTENGVTTKTKITDDGKIKVKGKAQDGSKIKGKAKPVPTPDGSTTSTSGTTTGVLVGGAMMTPDKDIVDNALNSTDHTTLIAAVSAAGLANTLRAAGPFTVFAPTNAAFDKLPTGTVNSLVMPENKTKLNTILTYHVVPGRLLAASLQDGQTLTTVEGETLTVLKKDGAVVLKDAKGGTSTITIADVISSNGITHVVDTVLMP